MNKKAETLEKENLSPKESSVMIAGVFMGVLAGTLMGIVGGVVSNYITMFSKEQMLENPLVGSILAVIITFFFLVLVFILLVLLLKMPDLYRLKRGQQFSNFLLSALKDSWKLYALLVVVPFCTIMFVYLYSNATAVAMKVRVHATPACPLCACDILKP